MSCCWKTLIGTLKEKSKRNNNKKTMSDSGIPIKILYDAIGMTVSFELENGDLYTGKLTNVEDNMNVTLASATKTTSYGKSLELAQVYVRGSSIVFFQLPDALKSAPALMAAASLLTAATDARGGGKGFGSDRQQRPDKQAVKRPRSE